MTHSFWLYARPGQSVSVRCQGRLCALRQASTPEGCQVGSCNHGRDNQDAPSSSLVPASEDASRAASEADDLSSPLPPSSMSLALPADLRSAFAGCSTISDHRPRLTWVVAW